MANDDENARPIYAVRGGSYTGTFRTWPEAVNAGWFQNQPFGNAVKCDTMEQAEQFLQQQGIHITRASLSPLVAAPHPCARGGHPLWALLAPPVPRARWPPIMGLACSSSCPARAAATNIFRFPSLRAGNCRTGEVVGRAAALHRPVHHLLHRVDT